jgi:hypothetical protein
MVVVFFFSYSSHSQALSVCPHNHNTLPFQKYSSAFVMGCVLAGGACDAV